MASRSPTTGDDAAVATALRYAAARSIEWRSRTTSPRGIDRYSRRSRRQAFDEVAPSTRVVDASADHVDDARLARPTERLRPVPLITPGDAAGVAEQSLRVSDRDCPSPTSHRWNRPARHMNCRFDFTLAMSLPSSFPTDGSRIGRSRPAGDRDPRRPTAHVRLGHDDAVGANHEARPMPSDDRSPGGLRRTARCSAATRSKTRLHRHHRRCNASDRLGTAFDAPGQSTACIQLAACSDDGRPWLPHRRRIPESPPPSSPSRPRSTRGRCCETS